MIVSIECRLTQRCPLGRTLALGLGISLSFALLAIVYIHTPLPNFEIRAKCIPTYPTFECPIDTYQAEKPNPVLRELLTNQKKGHSCATAGEGTGGDE
jgi:hypothetical protein